MAKASLLKNLNEHIMIKKNLQNLYLFKNFPSSLFSLFFIPIKSRVFLITLFLAAQFSLVAGLKAAKYEYPVKFVRITSLFGESRGTHFHSGIDFAGQQAVFPIADGRLLLAIDRKSDPRYKPMGPGNTVILEHEEGFRSYYYHLQGASLLSANGSSADNANGSPADRVEKDKAIAFMGSSGYSIGEHLHLEVEDLQRNLVMNPFFILPDYDDAVKPQIVSFLFKIRDRVYRIKKNSKFRYRGPIELYSVVWDFSNKTDAKNGRTKGVKRLTLSIDSKTFQVYDFSLLQKSEEGLAVSGQSAKAGNQEFYYFKKVYGLPFNFRLGEFIPSKTKHSFEIEVLDWRGNKSSYTFKVNFL